MPNKPLKPCNYPGCNQLTNERYCEKHKHVYDKHRGSANNRGYTYKWQQYRLHFLQFNPLCAECERNNKVTAATVVDHIKPHKGDEVLFWDSKNHQSLCKQCHDVKTATKDGGFGNRGRGV